MTDTLLQFSKIIHSHTAVIGYTPLSDEIQYEKEVAMFPCVQHPHIRVPQSAAEDPFVFAEKCIQEYVTLRPYILIPGRMFDQYGNRLGRGGGWYDRFLSKIPAEWLLVGITDSDHFSKEPLQPKAHDVPMDWIVVRDTISHTWSMYEGQRFS